MCGRFAADIPTPLFRKRFKIHQLEIQIAPRYNICPGMFLPVVTGSEKRDAQLMKWGLVPHWSREPTVKFSNINARAETITTSPAYNYSFAKKRCLIPASGFYEWKKSEDGSKYPYFFRLKNSGAFSFAGIWDTWKDAEGKAFDTCAIITCRANSVVESVHPRMPVILLQTGEDAWLSETEKSSELLPMLAPLDEGLMEGYRVSTDVNNPRIDTGNLTNPYIGS